MISDCRLRISEDRFRSQIRNPNSTIFRKGRLNLLMKMKTKTIIGLGLWLGLLFTVVSLVPRPLPVAGQSGGSAYLPLILKPVVADVTIAGLEINQAVQRADNGVPLVAGRNTIVRVYAEAPQEGPVSDVVVRLSASRDGSHLGNLDSAPVTIPVAASRDNAGSSVNFLLPAAWLSGDVMLTAVADPHNTLAETDETNNTLAAAAHFNAVPPLQVRIVPVQYQHTGPSFPGLYPAQPADYISGWLMRAYPISQVDVSYHAPYDFTGNLQNGADWLAVQCSGNSCTPVGGLLYETTYALKAVEVGLDSPIVYYALVPTDNGVTQWFSAGIAGIGWVGFRESVGLNLGDNDTTATLAGHEIGHNLGRRHAPCGNPSGVDPGYPYGGASIGEYGIDIPLFQFWTPATAVDMMSYCDPAWVSDYTYTGLYQDQVANGSLAAPAAAPALLIVAGLDGDGAIHLNPTYAFTAPAAAAVPGPYVVELLDGAGEVLARYPLRLREAAEEGVSARLLTAVMPLPDTPAAALRIVAADTETVALSRPLTPADDWLKRPAASASREGDTITLRWGQPETPAIIRYTADGGATWTGLGIDVAGGTFAVKASHLPAGETGLFEIILANTGSPAVLTVPLP